jgi:hypothetical protein
MDNREGNSKLTCAARSLEGETGLGEMVRSAEWGCSRLGAQGSPPEDRVLGAEFWKHWTEGHIPGREQQVPKSLWASWGSSSVGCGLWKSPKREQRAAGDTEGLRVRLGVACRPWVCNPGWQKVVGGLSQGSRQVYMQEEDPLCTALG